VRTLTNEACLGLGKPKYKSRIFRSRTVLAGRVLTRLLRGHDEVKPPEPLFFMRHEHQQGSIDSFILLLRDLCLVLNRPVSQSLL
jgi:hypothetical protein